MRAFVFVDVEGDHTKTVFKTISRIEGVKEQCMVTGQHDILVDIEVAEAEVISTTVLEKIRSIDGVIKTVTNIVI